MSRGLRREKEGTHLAPHGLEAPPQLHQRHVNVVSLLLLRRTGFCSAPSLRARQVDDLEYGALLPASHDAVQREGINGVRARGARVEKSVGFGASRSGIIHESNCLVGRGDGVRGQFDHLHSAVAVTDGELVPFLAQKVKNLFLVDFQHGCLEIPFCLVCHALQDGVDQVWHNARLLRVALDGVGFSGVGHSIGKQDATVTLQKAFEQGNGHMVEHVVLLRAGSEHARKSLCG